MTRIVLVRPGATDFDDQGRIKGTLDIPLNDHGREQVAELTESLSHHDFQAVYFTASQAAQETAAAIGLATDTVVRAIPDLYNLDHGLWSGLLIAEVKHRHPRIYRQWQDHPETVCPPQGETLAEAQERVREELDQLFRRHPQGTIALVVPEPLASVVRNELVPCAMGDLWEAECRCGNWEPIEVEGLPVKS